VTLDKRPTRGAALGAIAGILAGALALGVGQLVAGLTGSGGSPVVAVGELSIDSTPPAVKNFAITTFGSHDKLVLVSGILVVLALFAAGIGILAMRRLRNGMIGLGVFALIGVIAAATRPNASPGDLLPTLAGAAAAAFALMRLVRAAGPLAGVAGPPGRTALPPRDTGLPPYDTRDPASGRAESALSPGDPAGGGGTGRQPGPEPGRGTPEVPGPGEPPITGWGWSPSPSGRPPGRPRPARASQTPRRKFIVASVTAAGTATVAGLGGRYLTERTNVTQAQRALRVPAPATLAPPLPTGSDLKIPGLSPFITPNKAFYRVDTAIVLPEILPSSWHLRIHGMVQREINLTFDQLIRRPLLEDYVTLTCVSNPVAGPYVGNALWLGASVQSLLREAGIRAGADQLFCTSQDGFTCGTPVQTAMDGRDAMLAVAMNGQALPVEHGFPVRMVVPGLYGYVSACKWITDIEVTTYRANVAYWAQRGWSQQAPIKTESRIDVPSGTSELKPGKTAVAGVAWAQHKGIEAVEVRVDNGPWNAATLAAVPDIDTWRQWVWEWNATPGQHVIEARATDKTGYTQTALQEPPEPNGASGYPVIQVVVNRG
jgi:DMSO/TMAO reductase YedYZ molybdopterin-dependent catalytic subunit